MRKNIFKYIPLYFIQYRRRKSRIEININGIHNVSRRIFDNEDDYLIFIWYKCINTLYKYINVIDDFFRFHFVVMNLII